MFERIAIVFENCESITLKHEDVLYLKLYGTDDEIAIHPDGVAINKKAQSMCMIIKADAQPIEEALYSKWVCPTDRALLKDITQIIFIDKSGNNLVYHLKWPKGCDQVCDDQLAKYVGETSTILIRHIGKKKHKKYMLDEESAGFFI